MRGAPRIIQAFAPTPPPTFRTRPVSAVHEVQIRMSRPARLARRRYSVPAELVPLEGRRLFCAEHLGGLLDGDNVGTFPAISTTSAGLNDSGATTSVSATAAVAAPLAASTVSLGDVPALDSKPDAK